MILHFSLIEILFFLQGPSVNFENIEKSSMLRHAPPLLGEHTRSILQNELDYTPDQIAKLFQDKIIQ
jgi:crotonobetainyl-CoA:carnitine CoA-transferase CaiB-like acyl-CoA transferase